MVRTSIELPWFHQAVSKENINNAVKLAYNPNMHKEMCFMVRESTLLSTRMVKASFCSRQDWSFLQFYLIESTFPSVLPEQALEEAANDQPLNLMMKKQERTSSTLSFLTWRYSVQRGIEEFTAACDETNNTPDTTTTMNSEQTSSSHLRDPSTTSL